MLGRLCLDRCGLTCWIHVQVGGCGRGLVEVLGPNEGEQTPDHYPGQLLAVEPKPVFSPPLRGRGQFKGTVVGDLTSGLAAGLCLDSTAPSTFWSGPERGGTCSGSAALAWGEPHDHATPRTPVCPRAVASLVSTATQGPPPEGPAGTCLQPRQRAVLWGSPAQTPDQTTPKSSAKPVNTRPRPRQSTLLLQDPKLHKENAHKPATGGWESSFFSPLPLPPPPSLPPSPFPLPPLPLPPPSPPWGVAYPPRPCPSTQDVAIEPRPLNWAWPPMPRPAPPSPKISAPPLHGAWPPSPAPPKAEGPNGAEPGVHWSPGRLTPARRGHGSSCWRELAALRSGLT